jgi:cupin fold WbuC family metalloprotein
MIERIEAWPTEDGSEGLLAIIIRNNEFSTAEIGVTGLVGANEPLQSMVVAYPKDHQIQAHRHPPQQRIINQSQEVLVVMCGSCIVDIYSSVGDLARSCVLNTGDVLIILSGGHGFRMLEDTTLFEVKQGPYYGKQNDKVYYENNPTI